MKRLFLRIEQAAATAVLIPVAVAFAAGVVAWGVSRDLQRTRLARARTVRRVLVWLGGDVREEGGIA